MIKLPQNTDTSFVSDLANELSIALKEKYNRPIKSGKLINTLSEIFGYKDWNTLSALLNENTPTLISTISHQLLKWIDSDDFRAFMADIEKIKELYESGTSETLFDVLFYQFDLESKVEEFVMDDDYNANEIPNSYLNDAFRVHCEVNIIHSSDLSSWNNMAEYRAIQKMMENILNTICESMDDDMSSNNKTPYTVDIEELISHFKFYLNDSSTWENDFI